MPETAQLFITCLLDTLYPEIGEAIVRVLDRAGVQVEFPREQTCCGQPAFNAGMRAQARPIAKHTIEVFEKTTGPIIIPSGSCTAMIRHGYRELFTGETPWLSRAQSLSERTYEFTEFLVDLAPQPGKAVGQVPCQGIQAGGGFFLRAVGHGLSSAQRAMVLVRRILFCNCRMPYNRASAVGGQPGT